MYSSQVISTSLSIAGQAYTASRYTCQSCPDPLMTMTSSLQCSCPTGYTMVWVASYGTQSCVLTTTATLYLTLYGNAQNVKYFAVSGSHSGAAAGTTLVSTVMQHYVVKAAAGCAAYAGAATGSNQACEAWANLCVLQVTSRWINYIRNHVVTTMEHHHTHAVVVTHSNTRQFMLRHVTPCRHVVLWDIKSVA